MKWAEYFSDQITRDEFAVKQREIKKVSLLRELDKIDGVAN
jgi:hypothetical protein